MAVLTFAGRHPKGGLPVNAALASSSPRTNGIVNVRYVGDVGRQGDKGRGVGPPQREVGGKGSMGEAAR